MRNQGASSHFGDLDGIRQGGSCFSAFRYFGANCEDRLRCGRASIAQSRQMCFHGHVIRKVAAIVGSAVFLIIAPGFVAGLVPWWIAHSRLQPAFFGLRPLRFAGGVLITIGTAGLLDSFLRFAVRGLGTPAPVFPTRHLVVTGLYRHVRNPMYTAVVSVIVGQALIFGNARLLEYGVLVWL